MDSSHRLAANPGYQQPTVAPGTSAAPDYSAYYQQYHQQVAQPPVPGQSQPQQSTQSPLTPEEQYAQQYAAYYAQYGYSVLPASSAAPGSVVASAAAAAPPAAAATVATAPYNHPAYQGYYGQPVQAQPAYSYPTAAPGTQASVAPAYPYSAYPPAPPAPGTQSQQLQPPAPGSSLTSYPYSYQSQPQQQTSPPIGSSSYSQGRPYSKYNPGVNGNRQNSYNNKQAGPPAFDNQAFQRLKQLEAEEKRLQRFKEEQDKKNIQQKLHDTNLNDNGYTNGESNMSKTAYEKPAYLSVKSKKVKPLTTNVLEPQESSQMAGSSSSPSTSTSPSTANGKEGWPQSLKDYVQRMFEQVSDEYREEAQEELRNLVARYHARGELWDVDWEKMEVPSNYRKGKSRRQSDSPEDENIGDDERARREKRMRRFETTAPVRRPLRVEYAPPVYNADVIDWDEYTIVGTSTQLEKGYLRLTSAPDPATVRPVHILQKTIELLKEKWRKEQNYAYICDQLKSVRQDLTVQRIKSDFTVTVYEIHARIALERGDLGEYNQCQTQLKQLYEYNLRGHVMEFTAYRILYLLHTRNPSDIIAMLASLTAEQKKDQAVKHALKVRTALASSNYHQLFKLYLTAPNMGGYLMDQFVDRERVEAMKAICKAYRPSIDVGFLVTTLGFMDEGQCSDFLKTIGVHRCLNQEADEARKIKKYQYLDTKLALPYVVEAGKKYQKVDIKGQI
ncbi:hypothetical protein BGZ51_003216 [Haplosporangium sp. Z 767]|nr:hypothetical protein BGZ50_004827 [Haplosporangium sp. Z 11]KAF9184632.1 hypothetical protein BGZ51_003216 [Haplosporangium sp. Z 767]